MHTSQVKCTSCNEEHPKLVTLNMIVSLSLPSLMKFSPTSSQLDTQEEREVTAGKGSTAHFVWRCGLCKRESSARFEPNEKPRPYTVDANGQFAPFVTIDCRGLEFVGFDPKVCPKHVASETSFIFGHRGSGNALGWSRGLYLKSISRKRASGLTMTRRYIANT